MSRRRPKTKASVGRYQTVQVKLSDGRTGSFLGPELVTAEDERLGVRATFEFTLGKDLPPGLSFTRMEEPTRGDSE